MLDYALKKVRDGLLSITYPEQCRICANPVESWDDGVACATCWSDPSITRLLMSEPVCATCGAPEPNGRLTPEAQPSTEAWRRCGSCGWVSFASARACGLYKGAVEASILFLKSRPHVCQRLRNALRHTLAEATAALACDIIIPVPLHPTRQRERGFNQAAVVAKIVSSELGVQVDERSLARIKYTELHRAGMDSVDRARSVGHAFQVLRPRLIQGLSVLVTDDVYTTGSTVSAVAETLLKAGAQSAHVITLARVTKASSLPSNIRMRARSI